MPLLARMLMAPLSVDIHRGAITNLADLLADRRISAGGHVAVTVGPGLGEEVTRRITHGLGNAEVFPIAGGTVDAALDLGKQLRATSYDAVVAIGGGKTIDVTKYAASLAGLPMVAVATNLSHDGICSPVSSLEHEHGKGSFGVAMPVAIVVDLDYVRAAPERMVRSGVGDVVSNLSAVADWHLAARERGEPVDGLANMFAHSAAESIINRSDTISSDDFLSTLAEALVLSGMAMVGAGSSRPCSGGCHEILHAVDQLYPGTSNHGELAGVGALFCLFLSEDAQRTREVSTCLARHGLPRVPADVGLSDEQFVQAVLHAPNTRPDRYTILEHLALDADAARSCVEKHVRTITG